MIAPRIFMPQLLAVYIRMVTGIRSCFLRPNRWMASRLASQLWQPVSAMTNIYVGWTWVVLSLKPSAS